MKILPRMEGPLICPEGKEVFLFTDEQKLKQFINGDRTLWSPETLSTSLRLGSRRQNQNRRQVFCVFLPYPQTALFQLTISWFTIDNEILKKQFATTYTKAFARNFHRKPMPLIELRLKRQTLCAWPQLPSPESPRVEWSFSNHTGIQPQKTSNLTLKPNQDSSFSQTMTQGRNQVQSKIIFSNKLVCANFWRQPVFFKIPQVFWILI